MTIEDFLRLTLRNIVVLLVSILVCVGAAFGYYKLQTPIYQARALGYVSVSAGTDEQGNPVALASSNQTLQMDKASMYVSLFKTRAVGQGVIDDLGLKGASPDAVASGLVAWVDKNAPVIIVAAEDPDPRKASDIANAAVKAAAAEARRLDTGGNEAAQPVTVLVPYQEALAPSAPIRPKVGKFLLVGFGVGIFLGYMIAFLRFRADTRVRTVEDVEKKLETPVFAVLPESKALQREKGGELPEPNSFTEREALRKLRTNLRFLDIDNPPRVIVVTSAIPAEGKSTVSGNLARVLARSGQKTLLIDADLRRPVVHTEFDVDGSVGLTQLLTGRVALDDVVQKSSVRNLHVLPAGQIPPNPSELLGSRRMDQLLKELRKEYFVILDAPPVLPVTDATLLARQTDGALIVVSSGTSRLEVLTRAFDSMRSVDAKILGAVLNRVSTKRISRIAYGDAEYGYGSGYGYGSKYGYGANYGYGYGEIPTPEEDENTPEVELPDADSPVVATESHGRRVARRRAEDA
ncbi:polysaccharide biosynthesis tyrosine autokinase [Dermabacteraceae bacterium CCM 9520]